ncbi:22.0 kDa heat shock protein-like [Abrus precatorius]|uniref:22.0 kDa heat shock protein-like n=1 Tax=Abrus precatorius TaxID=3816 RepID=A0A8B8MLQ1_ABRPR|nr:22.0 kDa heat shock protein-like [Abrus precatorius]
MASARDNTRVGSVQTPVVEEIVPNSGWTEDSAGHYLLVDLPDFRKEEVKLQVDSYGRILVRGERQENERKRVHFRLTFPVPVDSDVDKIAGRFDGGILYVTVPKGIVQQQKGNETENAEHGAVEGAKEDDSPAPNADEGRRDPSQHGNHTEQEVKRNENQVIGNFPEQVIRMWEQDSMFRSAVEVLMKNKGIVITAVIAFSLGVFISRKI